jgi:hypothetical protein
MSKQEAFVEGMPYLPSDHSCVAVYHDITGLAGWL